MYRHAGVGGASTQFQAFSQPRPYVQRLTRAWPKTSRNGFCLRRCGSWVLFAPKNWGNPKKDRQHLALNGVRFFSLLARLKPRHGVSSLFGKFCPTANLERMESARAATHDSCGQRFITKDHDPCLYRAREIREQPLRSSVKSPAHPLEWVTGSLVMGMKDFDIARVPVYIRGNEKLHCLNIACNERRVTAQSLRLPLG